MIDRKCLLALATCLVHLPVFADTGLLLLDNSPYAQMQNAGLDKVYCLESNDVQGDVVFEEIVLHRQAEFVPEHRPNLLGGVTVLKTTAHVASSPAQLIVGQYRDIAEQKLSPIKVELIPYFAWNNRVEPKLSVWLPLSK